VNVTNNETEPKRNHPDQRKSQPNPYGKKRVNYQHKQASTSQNRNTQANKKFGRYNQSNSRRKPVYFHEAECSKCHKQIKVPFKPDGVRPVYCKICLNEVRTAEQNNEKFAV